MSDNVIYVFGKAYVTHADYKALEEASSMQFMSDLTRLQVLSDENIRLTAKLAECRRDASRLEWITSEKHMRVIGSDKTSWSVCDCSNGLTFASRGCKTMREAIDNAIARSQPE